MNRLIYRGEAWKTTWTLRLLVIFCAAALVATRSFWESAVGRSLVCAPAHDIADTVVLDNLDDDYLLFERAATLRQQRPELRVFVPVKAGSDVAEGFADVMARISRLGPWQAIPIRHVEPITLNAAVQIRDFLRTSNISTISIVTPALRSRRAALIYETVLGRAGIGTSCVPVTEDKTPETWAKTWHGIQEVVMQIGKLGYYRLWVLPTATVATLAGVSGSTR